MTAMSAITTPAQQGLNTVYDRTPNHSEIKPGDKLEAGFEDSATTPFRFCVYGPPAAGQWSLTNPGVLYWASGDIPRVVRGDDSFGSVSFPEVPTGPVVVTTTVPGFMHSPMWVWNNKDPKPPGWKPGYLAVSSTNMKSGEIPLTGHTWFWVPFPEKRRSFKRPARPSVPWDKPFSMANAWVETLTATSYGFLREPCVTGTGAFFANAPERYTLGNETELYGDNREGESGDGRIGAVTGGTALAGKFFAITPVAVGWVYADGRVEAIGGEWMKPGAFLPLDDKAKTAAYELRGKWMAPYLRAAFWGGCCTRDGVWGFIARPDCNDIIRVHIPTGTFEKLAGTGKHSAYGPNMTGGQIDGSGLVADFGHPLSTVLSPDESFLLVADDHNCAWRKIDRLYGPIGNAAMSCLVSTWHQSAMVHPHTSLGTLTAAAIDYMRGWSVDGPAGTWSSMHPTDGAWGPEGEFYWTAHHSFEYRCRLPDGSDRRIGLIKTGTGTTAYLPREWPTLDCDARGLLSGGDQKLRKRLLSAFWPAGSDDQLIPQPDGTWKLFNVIAPTINPYIEEGPGEHVAQSGYARLQRIGPDGAVWVSDTSTGGLRVITQKRPEDERFPAITRESLWTNALARDNRGYNLWHSQQLNGNPPWHLVFGEGGDNQLGLVLRDELASKSDAELIAYFDLRQYGPVDVEAFLAYFRARTMPPRQVYAKGNGDVDQATADRITAENAALQQQVAIVAGERDAEKKRADDCEAKCSAHDALFAALRITLSGAITSIDAAEASEGMPTMPGM